MTAPILGNSFDSLGIAPKLLEILHRNKFTTPTPIQLQSIPVAIQGKDIMGIAQTGTGKTLAFGIPMIQRLAQAQGKNTGLVILPTRELALQVNETLKKVGGPIGLKTAILIGGESMSKQVRMLQAKPHIIISTPGRLIDHMESGRVKFDDTSILVLDEADRMLDMGFAPQIKKILQRVPKNRQTLLFSATMPDAIVEIANAYMSIPLRIEVAPAGTAIDLVTQEVFFVPRDEKLSLLETLLKEFNGSVLIFTRTKFGAKKIAHAVRGMGHKSAEIHSNRTLNQRIEALEGFKIGRYRVLAATDIAARGIDVKGIQLVINYDLPENAEDYVHRIGRTGRSGMTGHAISFATPDQRHDVRSIERLIRMALPIAQKKASVSGGSHRERSAAMKKEFDIDSTPRDEGRGYRGRDQRSDRGDRRDSGSRGGYKGRSFGGPASARSSGSSRPARPGGFRPSSYGDRAAASPRPAGTRSVGAPSAFATSNKRSFGAPAAMRSAAPYKSDKPSFGKPSYRSERPRQTESKFFGPRENGTGGKKSFGRPFTAKPNFENRNGGRVSRGPSRNGGETGRPSFVRKSSKDRRDQY